MNCRDFVLEREAPAPHRARSFFARNSAISSKQGPSAMLRRKKATMATILVVGFGNTLMGDDGVGPMVIRYLAARTLPGNLRLAECASDSLILPSFWKGEAEIWMVDALVRREAGGTIHTLTHEQVLSIPQRHATVHHLSLPEGLRWIALTYPEMRDVSYRLWGVEPDRLDLGEQLSPAVEEAVSTVSTMIIDAAADQQQ